MGEQIACVECGRDVGILLECSECPATICVECMDEEKHDCCRPRRVKAED